MGLALLSKHNKATQHERSMNWDKLIELEEEAKNHPKRYLWRLEQSSYCWY